MPQTIDTERERDRKREGKKKREKLLKTFFEKSYYHFRKIIKKYFLIDVGDSRVTFK